MYKLNKIIVQGYHLNFVKVNYNKVCFVKSDRSELGNH